MQAKANEKQSASGTYVQANNNFRIDSLFMDIRNELFEVQFWVLTAGLESFYLPPFLSAGLLDGSAANKK
jgi:hypothetical protein